MEWGKDHPKIYESLPVEREILRYPKWYIIDICFTTYAKDFKEWVDAKVEERDKLIIEKADNIIDIDEELAKAFFASNH